MCGSEVHVLPDRMVAIGGEGIVKESRGRGKLKKSSDT